MGTKSNGIDQTGTKGFPESPWCLLPSSHPSGARHQAAFPKKSPQPLIDFQQRILSYPLPFSSMSKPVCVRRSHMACYIYIYTHPPSFLRHNTLPNLPRRAFQTPTPARATSMGWFCAAPSTLTCCSPPAAPGCARRSPRMNGRAE